MTCIVGIAKEGKVYIGADSLGSDGYVKDLYKQPKVFVIDKFIIGYTSSYRMGQILERSWSPPKRKEGVDDDLDYIIDSVIPSIRKSFKDGGYAEVENSRESGGFFLMGYNGRIFLVQNDFSVLEPVSGYTSTGSGEAFAKGSLYSTEHLKDVKKRIKLAIEASAIHCTSVGLPVSIKSI